MIATSINKAFNAKIIDVVFSLKCEERWEHEDRKKNVEIKEERSRYAGLSN